MVAPEEVGHIPPESEPVGFFLRGKEDALAGEGHFGYGYREGEDGRQGVERVDWEDFGVIVVGARFGAGGGGWLAEQSTTDGCVEESDAESGNKPLSVRREERVGGGSDVQDVLKGLKETAAGCVGGEPVGL